VPAARCSCSDGTTTLTTAPHVFVSQALGTHNSYHVMPPQALLALLTSSAVESLLGSYSQVIPSAWEATQLPLDQQLGRLGAVCLGAAWVPFGCRRSTRRSAV
jgi:hypothetical protein